MKTVFQCVLLLLAAQGPLNALGQVSDAQLKVRGANCLYSLREPAGWTGDTQLAGDYYANIIFYKNRDEIRHGGAIIQVYSFDKKDENTEKDLAFDVKSYKDKYRKLKSRDVTVSHKDYKCYAKLVYVDNDFYQYIVYLNPGPSYKTGISVAMNVGRREANEEEMRAFRQLVSSLLMEQG